MALIFEPFLATTYFNSMENANNELIPMIFQNVKLVEMVTTKASFLIFFALVFSNLLAYGWPQQYKKWVTHFTVKIWIICIWVYSVLFCFLPSYTTIPLSTFYITDWVLNSAINVGLVVMYSVTLVFKRKTDTKDDSVMPNFSPSVSKVDTQSLHRTYALVFVLIPTILPFILFLYKETISRTDEENQVFPRFFYDVMLSLKFLFQPVVVVLCLPKYRQSVAKVYSSLSKARSSVTINIV
jgi:hypothetical protein